MSRAAFRSDSIVGRTGYCIHPAHDVGRIPKVGGTKNVNVEKIRKLAPTHLVVNVDENEQPTVAALEAFVPHVVVTHPQPAFPHASLSRMAVTPTDLRDHSLVHQATLPRPAVE